MASPATMEDTAAGTPGDIPRYPFRTIQDLVAYDASGRWRIDSHPALKPPVLAAGQLPPFLRLPNELLIQITTCLPPHAHHKTRFYQICRRTRELVGICANPDGVLAAGLQDLGGLRLFMHAVLARKVDLLERLVKGVVDITTTKTVCLDFRMPLLYCTNEASDPDWRPMRLFLLIAKFKAPEMTKIMLDGYEAYTACFLKEEYWEIQRVVTCAVLENPWNFSLVLERYKVTTLEVVGQNARQNIYHRQWKRWQRKSYRFWMEPYNRHSLVCVKDERPYDLCCLYLCHTQQKIFRVLKNTAGGPWDASQLMVLYKHDYLLHSLGGKPTAKRDSAKYLGRCAGMTVGIVVLSPILASAAGGYCLFRLGKFTAHKIYKKL